ncbi:MAG: DUF1924 domain-containing protein [Gammaproteobacteria bacterium]
MSIILRTLLVSLAMTLSTTALASSAVDTLLSEYRQAGAKNFSASHGKRLWNQAGRPRGANTDRSCASCHTSDVQQPGRHAVTGKPIKPLAPSVLSRRLTNIAKVRKWLRRNCLWTRGRECTAQEKGDLLTYLRDQ